MKCISIVNNRLGSGKSTTAMHLGHRLTELDFNVLLIDMHEQYSCTETLIDHKPQNTIYDVLTNYDVINNSSPISNTITNTILNLLTFGRH